ncbi:putative reverse transcriptase domain-containing protein [Tanacetum coccineum]
MRPVSSIRFSSTVESYPSDSPATTLDRRSHSSPHSVGPSRKRCRSPATTMPSSILALGASYPTRVDLLPPRKRFRDSYSSKDSIEEDFNADVLADIEVDAVAAEATVDMDVEAGVDAGIGIEVGVEGEDEGEHEAESSNRGTIEVEVDVVARIYIPVGSSTSLGSSVFTEAEGEPVPNPRDGSLGRKARSSSSSVLAAYEANCAAELVVENQNQNGDNGNNKNGGGNGDENGGGNGNGNGGGNENGNPNRNDRGAMPVTRECTYHDFVKCKPLNFKGSEGVVRTIEADDAFAMSWRELMKLMIEMIPVEEDRVEKFIGGLPDNIQGNNVARAYTAGNNERRGYAGPWPYCNKYKLHHEGQCTVRCSNYKKVGHMARDCKALVPTTTRGAPKPNHNVGTCYECGRQGHYRSDCPKLKNQNRRNKTRNKTNEARGRAYVLGGGDANPDSNVVSGTFLLNNRHASMLFDSGADRSSVSSSFSALLDVIPSTLDVSYVVKLADGRIAETNNVLKGYTLGLLGHLFNIDLMPVELGSFNVIIGMDWLANHHAVIVCDEKIVRIPYGDEFLKSPSNKVTKERSFSKIAKPMTKLTQKSMKFDWGEKEEAAFQLLKQKLCSAPILALPKGSENFMVYCDASHKGLGAVLMQKEKCVVFTDHKNLQHILDQKKLNMRQRRWLELLSDYDCESRYHPRKTIVVADALSRKEQIKPLRV